MAQKHLHELLKEDQEPFHLKNFISDRRFQLKKPIHKTTLQVKKHKPIVYKQACFLSFKASPDVRKSTSFNFPSPLPTPKSPCKSPNAAVFLHIPVKTAALLLEAAMKIQKQKHTQIKNMKFGLFGSILKKLKDRNRGKKREIGDTEFRVSATESGETFRGKCEKVRENRVVEDEKSVNGVGFSWYSNNSRLSSAGWSESNEEKSSSCRSESESEETEFVAEERENGCFILCEDQFCSSPFRFSLQRSPSDDRRTPDFLSPATSPSRYKPEDKEHYEIESLQKIQEEEEEEKKQCSPVCVLDPPFEDEDDDGHESLDMDDDDDDNDYDIECSYAIVQRAKLHLLEKLSRFEKLAELDPIELGKRMLDEQDNEDGNKEDKSFFSDTKQNVDEIFSRSNTHCLTKAPTNMKRLVSDLIGEEEEKREMNGLDDNEVVAKRVCKRLDAWKGVESNTIDMMVGLDFRRELDGWNKYRAQVDETAMEIELDIFRLLVEELSDEN